MRFPCYGYVHQSVGIHTQHLPLVTKPLHCQALLRVQCKTTAVPRESSALQLAQTAKAWDCIGTHLPFAVSSVSFLSFSVVAPDLHLQKWKQKELGMPAIVCVTGTCIKYSCKCSIRPHWPRYKQFVVLSNLFYSKYLCLHALVNGKCVNVWQDCSSCWVFDSVYCKISIPYAEWKYLYIKLIRWVIFMNVAQEVLQHQWQIFMQLLQKFRFCPVLKHEGVQGEKWNIWKRKLSRSFKKEVFLSDTFGVKSICHRSFDSNWSYGTCSRTHHGESSWWTLLHSVKCCSLWSPFCKNQHFLYLKISSTELKVTQSTWWNDWLDGK